MFRRINRGLSFLFLAAFAMSGCSSGGGGNPGGNPVPTITALSPLSASPGGSAFTLMVVGTNYISGSIVRWNGSDRPTTFVNSTQLSAAIPASDIAAGGTVQVTVFNPAPGGGTSGAMTFNIGAGVLERVSVTTSGGLANSASGEVAMSANGRFVVFSSFATNLVAGDTNNATDIFLRDTCNGVPIGCTPFTIRVSVANDGSQADTGGVNPAISADGRFVTFLSFSMNLVPNDTNGAPEIFLRDTCIGAAAGCTASTTRIAVSTAGVQADSRSDWASLSANGRYVAFTSPATNLVANDTNSYYVFVRDTCFNAPANCTPSTTPVSLTSTGGLANGLSYTQMHSISGDGRFVVFVSLASNIVPNDNNALQDIFVRDTCTGGPAGCIPTTVRASVSTVGGDIFANSFSPAISADGRYVSFETDASNLVNNDTNGSLDSFLRDTCLGAPAGCVPSTLRVSVSSSDLQGDSGSGGAVIGADGRFVAFTSSASNLVAGDTNAVNDVFVRDTCLGATTPCTPATRRASVTVSGAQADGASEQPSLSADGRFVAFVSFATNFVSAGTNALGEVYLARTGF